MLRTTYGALAFGPALLTGFSALSGCLLNTWLPVVAWKHSLLQNYRNWQPIQLISRTSFVRSWALTDSPSSCLLGPEGVFAEAASIIFVVWHYFQSPGGFFSLLFITGCGELWWWWAVA